jgi:hypothetical protein
MNVYCRKETNFYICMLGLTVLTFFWGVYRSVVTIEYLRHVEIEALLDSDILLPTFSRNLRNVRNVRNVTNTSDNPVLF